RYFDAHCHLQDQRFENQIDLIIEKSLLKKVGWMCSCGTSESDWDQLISLSSQFSCIIPALAVHPWYIDSISENWLTLLEEKLITHGTIIGECGLDYYRDSSKKEIQKKVFQAHLEVSSVTNLPVIIHNRSSDIDMENILVSQMKKKAFSGVLHCYSSSKRLAEIGIELGLYISFSGIVTFKNADEVRDIVKIVPNNRILVETDAPYLSPVPNRGKRNEPENIWYTANELANIKNIEFEEISRITTENALRLFNI
ncbi:MAG: TatD family hydrolase, partial [Rhodobiaceae bacterium]|nr:TatD family hydrolase [Rhodobiaceae bacterium]